MSFTLLFLTTTLTVFCCLTFYMRTLIFTAKGDVPIRRRRGAKMRQKVERWHSGKEYGGFPSPFPQVYHHKVGGEAGTVKQMLGCVR